MNMKKHIADSYWEYQNGLKVLSGYKTLCGKKATTIEDAISKGFQSGVSLKNPNACKTCQEIAGNNKYWHAYYQLKNIKKY